MSSHFQFVAGKDYADFIPRGLYADMSGNESCRDTKVANDGSYHGSGMAANIKTIPMGTAGQILRNNSDGIHCWSDAINGANIIAGDLNSSDWIYSTLACGSDQAKELAILRGQLAVANAYISFLLDQASTELIELEPTVDPVTAYEHAMKGV